MINFIWILVLIATIVVLSCIEYGKMRSLRHDYHAYLRRIRIYSSTIDFVTDNLDRYTTRGSFEGHVHIRSHGITIFLNRDASESLIQLVYRNGDLPDLWRAIQLVQASCEGPVSSLDTIRDILILLHLSKDLSLEEQWYRHSELIYIYETTISNAWVPQSSDRSSEEQDVINVL